MVSKTGVLPQLQRAGALLTQDKKQMHVQKKKKMLGRGMTDKAANVLQYFN